MTEPVGRNLLVINDDALPVVNRVASQHEQARPHKNLTERPGVSKDPFRRTHHNCADGHRTDRYSAAPLRM